MYKMNESLFYDEMDPVKKNVFLKMETQSGEIPVFEDIKDKLPIPFWKGHEDTISAHYKAWEIAFGNIKKAKSEARFVSDFIDTAFNGFLFMWDSSFIMMFCKYASHIFDFQKTMDNFYSHQHIDGFICREICESQDGEMWHRDDPRSTGPNILAWCEWEHFKLTGDKDRLEKVFWPLLAYHKWLKLNRTWRNGGYWSCGFACGMDNTPRVPDGYSHCNSHGHMVWVDACAQMLLSGKYLIKMGKILSHEEETKELSDEIVSLEKMINEKMWNDEDGFYYDLWKDDKLSNTKTIGSYWTLFADVVPKERMDRFVAHLDNEKEFKRPHRVPTLSADHPLYEDNGGYWLGGVWAPTNYMVLLALGDHGYDELAFDIASSHIENVTKVYNETGTLWENYSPELQSPGSPARRDFVGWTGLSPISVLFEYVFGIRADSSNNEITWNINLTECHGIKQYPFNGGFVDFECEERKSKDEKPKIKIESTVDFTLKIKYNGTKETINITKD